MNRLVFQETVTLQRKSWMSDDQWICSQVLVGAIGNQWGDLIIAHNAGVRMEVHSLFSHGLETIGSLTKLLVLAYEFDVKIKIDVGDRGRLSVVAVKNDNPVPLSTVVDVIRQEVKSVRDK